MQYERSTRPQKASCLERKKPAFSAQSAATGRCCWKPCGYPSLILSSAVQVARDCFALFRSKGKSGCVAETARPHSAAPLPLFACQQGGDQGHVPLIASSSDRFASYRGATGEETVALRDTDDVVGWHEASEQKFLFEPRTTKPTQPSEPLLWLWDGVLPCVRTFAFMHSLICTVLLTAFPFCSPCTLSSFFLGNFQTLRVCLHASPSAGHDLGTPSFCLGRNYTIRIMQTVNKLHLLQDFLTRAVPYAHH